MKTLKKPLFILSIAIFLFGLNILYAGVAISGSASLVAKDNPEHKYVDNKVCGFCHKEQFKDYSASMMGRTPGDKVFRQFYLAQNSEGKFDGMGYKGAFPGKAGDCGNCHTPDIVLNEGKEMDIDEAVKKGSKGISCDFCHTVSDVKVILNKKTGRYDTDIMRTVVRARGNIKRGPLNDAVSPVHKTAFSPIHTKSEFCAMCHLNQEHLLSLSTYSDWKTAFDKGIVKEQCQDCHMPTGGKDRPIALGGRARQASQIHRHLFHGGHDPEMVKKAATMKVGAKRQKGNIEVTVDITNSGVGHKFPDGATLRNVILLVRAEDAGGRPLAHRGAKAELLPPLAGPGKSKGDYAGSPGAMFARPFVTKTGKAPAGGFNAARVLFDTRIDPRETASRSFHFSAPKRGKARISARLIYRWTYKPLADKKGWKMNDIVIAEKSLLR